MFKPQKFRILLVDDDEDEYILVKDLLEDRSFFPEWYRTIEFDLSWVATYEVALKAFQSNEYDLYLVDYSLGAKDGISLVRQASSLGNKAPIIILTGLESYEMDIAAMQAGAVDYLVKSHINGQLLERSIRYALDRVQAEKALLKAQNELEQRVVERTIELEEANAILRAEIRERQQAQEALKKSELRFRTIFENSGVGILILHRDGQILNSNPAIRAMLGYTPEELSGLQFQSLAHSEDPSSSQEQFQRLVNAEVDSFQGERLCAHKSGSKVWVYQTVSVVVDQKGGPQFVIAMIENISERKQIETELVEVRRRLMDSSEIERLQLAQELHDGPVQDLYGATFLLEQLRDGLDPSGLSSLTQAKGAIQQVIDMLRVTCGELRPPTLAPFGLEVAIRSHAENFAQAHPEIQVTLDLEPDGKLMPERQRLAIYRIYQQALANILRHAKATEVQIRFGFDASQVQLEIRDNGQGFVVPKRWIDLVRQGHLGLAGASERAEAIGGSMSVQSAPGQGTVLRIWAPRAPVKVAAED